jgi:hypothetical protein
MKCIHRDVSSEAYDEHGKPITVYLCSFPDNEPGRFVDAPRWLLRTVGAGLAIDPEKDCVDCPAFQKPKARALPSGLYESRK